jgi:hypothetical protein
MPRGQPLDCRRQQRFDADLRDRTLLGQIASQTAAAQIDHINQSCGQSARQSHWSAGNPLQSDSLRPACPRDTLKVADQQQEPHQKHGPTWLRPA